MTRFRARLLLEKILGRQLLAYLLHLRPLEWPIMTAHFLLGTFLALGWPWKWKPALFAWFLFVVALNGGTLALNSAFDKDEGDIGYLRQPPPVPRFLAPFGYGLLALAFFGSMAFIPVKPGGHYFFEIMMTCVLMSVLYSVPPIRLKARAGWDLVINCLGFGFFTPMAGWVFTGRGLEKPLVDMCLGFLILFASLYPMTQIYQVEEDTARGDQTLVIRMGVGRSLSFAILAAVVAHLWFAQAVLARHGNPMLLLVSLLAWVGVLVPWRLRWKAMSAAAHESGMYRGLAAWAITDLSLLLLLWPKSGSGL
ncbi:MAG TPA: UbiA family prenyltransferase [Holophagaceae bacterium]|nr:UbiA family prenyltransferase [Holophagaceae bacterium]